MKIKILGGVLVAALAVTSAASAQTRTPVVNHRQVRQERRIAQGERSGELTRHETRSLQRGERKIQADKRMAKANGRVTPHERQHLRREQNRMSRAIYRDKHNRRVRKG
ncbi:MAG TPA: hypothetical protein VHE59_04465 [Mucilaginibacter sp.]|nr:hypothetical protein [Mucilaginibacter sp.]